MPKSIVQPTVAHTAHGNQVHFTIVPLLAPSAQVVYL